MRKERMVRPKSSREAVLAPDATGLPPPRAIPQDPATCTPLSPARWPDSEDVTTDSKRGAPDIPRD